MNFPVVASGISIVPLVRTVPPQLPKETAPYELDELVLAEVITVPSSNEGAASKELRLCFLNIPPPMLLMPFIWLRWERVSAFVAASCIVLAQNGRTALSFVLEISRSYWRFRDLGPNFATMLPTSWI